MVKIITLYISICTTSAMVEPIATPVALTVQQRFLDCESAATGSVRFSVELFELIRAVHQSRLVLDDLWMKHATTVQGQTAINDMSALLLRMEDRMRKEVKQLKAFYGTQSM